ncbi:hypothetical protein Ciccas_007699 [Cichlidogyrus casuarinus]|uniref:Glutamate receptor n=1 Tax=Cichlidogyrus casuarinus TaxID=1844966 RepID=A0ABD2Q2U5_9PLAT
MKYRHLNEYPEGKEIFSKYYDSSLINETNLYQDLFFNKRNLKTYILDLSETNLRALFRVDKLDKELRNEILIDNKANVSFVNWKVEFFNKRVVMREKRNIEKFIYSYLEYQRAAIEATDRMNAFPVIRCPTMAYSSVKPGYDILKSHFMLSASYNAKLFSKFKLEWSCDSGKIAHAELTKRSNDSLHGRHLTVVTVEEDPFVRYNPKTRNFSGYAIDLLEELKQRHGFKYTLKFATGKTFGKMDASGRWNGIIGDLIDGKADLAIGSLTVTYDREQVIDFTTPFMSLALSVIIKKKASQSDIFQFMAPLSTSVWLSMLGAYLCVSILLFVIGRISPQEWYQRHPCNEQIENHFTLLNSFWFTVGSLMQQGCDISPRATSTRIVGTVWWFFILIMVSSYTANLAAFLTIDRLETDIENIKELANQDKIKFGILKGGSTSAFFENSNIELYMKMFATMNLEQGNFVSSTTEGINKTLNEPFAFILESPLNEYYSQVNCELVMLGSLLDPRGYAIGLPVGS